MMPGRLNSSAGFTYIAALVMVAIMGIMLGAIGQSMQIVMKREREKELIFRGLQIRDALERWSKKGTANLQELKQLLAYGPNSEPLLRRLYNDPVTGKEWKILKDPNLGIYGVASTSEDEPMKIGDFPDIIKEFKGKRKYSEWEFVYKRTGSTPAGSTQNIPSMPLSTPEGP